jgi:hypothetical protein
LNVRLLLLELLVVGGFFLDEALDDGGRDGELRWGGHVFKFVYAIN